MKLLLLTLLAAWYVFMATVAGAADLAQGFAAPPASARPWVYWMWLRVDSTPEAIRQDLEAMHAKGIEGVILYDSGAGTEVQGKSKMIIRGKGYVVVSTGDFRGARMSGIPSAAILAWGDRQRQLFRIAAKEAGRLGIRLCLAVGLAGTSGFIPIEYGQQVLVWSEINLNGPQRFDGVLPAPYVPGKKNTPYHGHEIAVLALPNKPGVSPANVVDLSAKMDAAGHLLWDAPRGAWSILRLAYVPTGAANAWGYFTDGMSAEALDRTWEVTIGQLLKEMTPEERKGLVAIEDDSWEAGVTTWTAKYPAEFKRLREYDLIPWLPVLAGRKMGRPGEAEAVRRDFRRTIADLVAKNHYSHLQELAHRNGLVLYSEPSGPNTAQLDLMLNCKDVDFAMGEFWYPSPHRSTPAQRFLLRNAASANHIYGKPLTACESLTSIGPCWEETFFDMKNTVDQAFCDGCNMTVIHNYSHSPSVAAKPGYAYFAGTHYNRNVTWWDQTPAFNAYLGRCSFLLQQGLFVADALYYHGDAIGQLEPMKTRPALPADGYDHDNCNLDALLTRVSVKDGRLVLPDGMSYSILVLPDDSPLAPEALDKIVELVEKGATVVGPRPRGMAGFPVTGKRKLKFDAAVSRLWGSGKIPTGQPLDVLRAMHISPQLEYTGLSAGGELDWIHRRETRAAGSGDVDIFFIASRWDPNEKVNCVFRVCRKQPELWDPVTGEIRDAVAFRQENGRTVVPLEFNPRQSVFVVFRKPIPADAAGYAVFNTTARGKLGKRPKMTVFTVISHAAEPAFLAVSGDMAL